MGRTIERAQHIQDPTWLIALWLAIHGGDPAPDQFSHDLSVLSTINLLASQLQSKELAQRVQSATREHLATMAQP